MHVEVVAEITPELVDDIGRLLPQLSSDARRPTLEDLQAVIAAPGNILLAARDEPQNRLMGILTLVVYPTPNKVLSLIEDVVVDSTMRNRGAGSALVAEAIRLAKARGASQTDLLSNERRAAAIRMYERSGFKRYPTNVFRMVH